MGTDVNRSNTWVSRRLRKEGIPRRSGRKYSCNEDFFETINTEEKSYWLGFLAADGCVHVMKRKRLNQSPQFSLSLSQSIKDKRVLELFKEHLEATYLVHSRKREQKGKEREFVRIRITSKNLCKDLINKGVVPRKTLILKPPKNIPDSLIHHWIRGYFDGDGCISFRKGNRHSRKITIAGTLEVMRFIQDCLGGIGHIYDWGPRAQVHRFQIAKQEDVKRFADYIYQDATVYLERKFIKFRV